MPPEDDVEIVMRYRIFRLCLLCLVSAGAWAQAPVENGSTPDTVLGAQQKAGAAYKDWQQALDERTRTEKAAQRAADAYASAQKKLEETKQDAETTKQKAEAAKAREEAAHANYDRATRVVDRVWSNNAAQQK